MAVILVVFYLFTGIKLLRRLKSSQKKGRKVSNLKQVGYRSELTAETKDHFYADYGANYDQHWLFILHDIRGHIFHGSIRLHPIT